MSPNDDDNDHSFRSTFDLFFMMLNFDAYEKKLHHDSCRNRVCTVLAKRKRIREIFRMGGLHLFR